jgi:putative MFS transporter
MQPFTQQRDLLSLYASSRPTKRYFGAFSVFCLGFTLDFFDFYLVGFLLAVLGPGWHLTYGESSLILLSAGAGAIVGSLFSGSLADAFGRKRVLLVSTTICGLGAGAVAFLPEGGWLGFAALRFLVGCGLAGAATTQTVLLVEHTPASYRTRLTGFPFIAASVGSLIASISAATLLHAFGWRGVAALGFAPLLVTLSAALFVPESGQWLISKGRLNEARKVFARLLGIDAVDLPTMTAATSVTAAPAPNGRISELLSFPGRTLLVVVTWAALSTAGYGVYLWGPTIVALLLKISPSEAAKYFIVVSLAGIAGRLLLSLLPMWMTRRRVCAIFGFGIAVSLGVAGLGAQHTVAGFPLFVAMVAVGALFFDGGWCVIGPYSAEIFPTRLAARAIGVGQAANGIGKILGPLCLAVIAGTGNVITPRATTDAVLPAFLFLACCGLLIGILFAVLAPADASERGETGIETLSDTPGQAVNRIAH